MSFVPFVSKLGFAQNNRKPGSPSSRELSEVGRIVWAMRERLRLGSEEECHGRKAWNKINGTDFTVG